MISNSLRLICLEPTLVSNREVLLDLTHLEFFCFFAPAFVNWIDHPEQMNFK